MRAREQAALWAYLGAANCLLPPVMLVALPLLLLRQKRRATFFRRLGFQEIQSRSRGDGPLWVHALSLGETLSCIPLVTELKRALPDRSLAFSVSTNTAMEIARKKLHSIADQLLYFPYDLWWSGARFLNRLNPEMAIFVETDIWPGFQYQLRGKRIHSMLVNGRLSPSTFASCRRWQSLFAPALNTFDRIYPQSPGEADRYSKVGVCSERVGPSGNLKFDVAAQVPDEEELHQLQVKLGLQADEKVLLAGSTHPGEEETVLKCFAQMRGQFPPLKLLLVPRHPARADEVLHLARSITHKTSRFSQLPGKNAWEVVVVDVMGVLSKLYHLASIAFIGGSLVPKGGQNPIESAAAGCPALFGPDMSDFPDIASWLLEREAAIQIRDGATLFNVLLSLLNSPARRQMMGEKGRALVAENSGATNRIILDIQSMLHAKVHAGGSGSGGQR